MESTATAYLNWNERWQTGEGRAEWSKPDPAVVAVAEHLKERGARSVLDLGCGIGRHALYLAELGFDVSAIDGSEAGILQCRREAQSRGLSVRTDVAMMDHLPFGDATFDYVLSFNVIYHGDLEVVSATVAEIRRVLKPEGLFQGTMLSKRNDAFGKGEEVAPDTWVDPHGGDDKAHPHFYCDSGGLVSTLRGFELLNLEDREHKRAGHWHWYFLAERLAAEDGRPE